MSCKVQGTWRLGPGLAFASCIDGQLRSLSVLPETLSQVLNWLEQYSMMVLNWSNLSLIIRDTLKKLTTFRKILQYMWFVHVHVPSLLKSGWLPRVWQTLSVCHSQYWAGATGQQMFCVLLFCKKLSSSQQNSYFVLYNKLVCPGIFYDIYMCINKAPIDFCVFSWKSNSQWLEIH